MVNASLRKRVLDMAVGESIVIPLNEYAYTTVRSYVSDFSFTEDRKYSAHRSREQRAYIITRHA